MVRRGGTLARPHNLPFPGQTAREVRTLILWYFWIYSFLGILLEKLFAHCTRSPHQVRRCFVFLPLCPVYGLGMLAVLAAPELPLWLLPLWGGFAATVVEYAVHWAYDAFLGVRFWDYSHVAGNLGGRVCLPFSAAWGLLTAAAVIWVQPGVAALASAAPPWLTYALLFPFTADAVASAWVLKATGDIDALGAYTTWKR